MIYVVFLEDDPLRYKATGSRIKFTFYAFGFDLIELSRVLRGKVARRIVYCKYTKENWILAKRDAMFTKMRLEAEMKGMMDEEDSSYLDI